MFKNLKIRKREEKLVDNNKMYHEMAKEAELLMVTVDDLEIKDAIKLVKEELEYAKTTTNKEAKKYDSKINNMLQDLKIVLNKKEKAINLTKEIVKTIKQRDVIC